jgi:hypothetical protein
LIVNSEGKAPVVVMEKDKIIHDTGEIKNMITNQGMDEVATDHLLNYLFVVQLELELLIPKKPMFP